MTVSKSENFSFFHEDSMYSLEAYKASTGGREQIVLLVGRGKRDPQPPDSPHSEVVFIDPLLREDATQAEVEHLKGLIQKASGLEPARVPGSQLGFRVEPDARGLEECYEDMAHNFTQVMGMQLVSDTVTIPSVTPTRPTKRGK